VGERGHFEAAVQRQLLEDVVHVALDGMHGDVQPGRDRLVAQPLPEEESSFDDFDDEFDDDFEEEENDPDWDHPEENEPLPPPAKGPSKKK
jgi:hypothetical protein